MKDEILFPVKCSKCGHNRWRTLEKRFRYICRNCNHVRDKRNKKK